MSAPADETGNRLRAIPSINTLLETEEARHLAAEFSRERVRDGLRERLARFRDQGSSVPNDCLTTACLIDAVRHELESWSLSGLQPVINATGIVLHTNLGRAPLPEAALAAVVDTCCGYSNLEFGLTTGKRGGRGGLTEDLLRRLTGAESALVVNNNAAGVLLALSALADGGEVLVSRGELVEIGGSFRVPDVIQQGGARLVEVGSTNKTRLSDYENAISDKTRIILKVHASNYRIIGHASETKLQELTELARKHNLVLMEDLGSGALIDLTQHGLPAEPTVSQVVQSGADVVAFSGDKLLGGPQSGLIVGKSLFIRRMAQHPLFRALRADKMALAALEATLKLYEDPDRLRDNLPVFRMLTQSLETLSDRAERLRAALEPLTALHVSIKDGDGYSGGGTLPEHRLPSRHVHVQSALLRPDQLAEKLRAGQPAIVGKVADGAFILDVRTIHDRELTTIADRFRRIFHGEGGT